MITTIQNGIFYIGECLEVMKKFPDNSIDFILCDPPYQTTDHKWDSVLPMDKIWTEYKRLLKRNSVVALFGSQPFTTSLINSNPEWFKYEFIWLKKNVTGFAHAKNAPMKRHENILVFSDGSICHAGENKMPYFPQGLTRIDKPRRDTNKEKSGLINSHKAYTQEWTGYPNQILEFPKDRNNIHPTQKPVALLEYLIKTYTQPGMTVLDNCAGSGSLAIAAENTDRKWVCIEKDEDYATKAIERIRQTKEK